MTDGKIKIMVVDDHKIITDGLNLMLSLQPNIEVVATADSGDQAVAFANDLQLDVIIMDIMMPGTYNGVQATKLITDIQPDVKVIALSLLGDVTSINAMLQAGARGYLIKNSSSKQLEMAIREVMADKIYIHPELLQYFVTQVSEGNLNREKILTERELEILELITNGFSTKEIATKLFRSEETIRSHRKNLLRKFDCKNVAELVKYAIIHHLVRF